VGKAALDHGKHVLCEKPLCLNAKDTKELVEYARKKKLFFMEVRIRKRFIYICQQIHTYISKD